MPDDEPEREPETIADVADDVDDLQEEIDAVGASILAALGEQALAIAALVGRLDEHIREFAIAGKEVFRNEHEPHPDRDATAAETEATQRQGDETPASATDAPAMEESTHEQPTASERASEPPRHDRRPERPPIGTALWYRQIGHKR